MLTYKKFFYKTQILEKKEDYSIDIQMVSVQKRCFKPNYFSAN